MCPLIMASVFFSPASFLIEYPGMCAFFVSLLYTVSFLTECVCVLRNFVHGDVTCPGRPTGWTIDVTISCYTPTPTPQDGQSYVKLSTQWGGHVTAHCPPSGMDKKASKKSPWTNVRNKAARATICCFHIMTFISTMQ